MQDSKQEIQRLRGAIHEHDFLHRILRRVEHMLKVVFHAHDLDWQFVRAAAEEILIADVLTRHAGSIDGVYFALRKAEQGGHTWEQALAEYAGYAHNYFTTPLGVVMRRRLFGDDCHFVTTAGRPASKRGPAMTNEAVPRNTVRPPETPP